MDEVLIKYLKENGIKYVIHEHPAIFTVEESKKLIKVKNYFHTKNLFLKDEKGNFYLVCMGAEDKLNLKEFQKSIGVKKITFGSAEELKDKLNLAPGSVSIFGMIYSKGVSLYLDEQIYKAEKVGFHPNKNTSTLELNHKDLVNFLNSLKSKKHIIKLPVQ